ncbi:MAG TPA: dTDP-4-dehydrorhamnose reductase [Solirubrobacteraceae bacterium]|jgi:dTDP-4-dehydrorhamnose reductase|nr:dTDP-4-dehydrorhamnose reductase [Solirubrobacteraceae bacterium]
MRVLVTGAGGMLGGAVSACARARGHELTALSHAELDIAAPGEALRGLAPEVVINCAAWTDVDGAEADPDGAHALNGEAAGAVARACTRAGARLVHVSTDYVFDGDAPTGPDGAPRPWVESDPVRPRSAYGSSKLAGERAIAAAGPEHAIVRTAWLFGPGGKNFLDTMLTLGAEREEVSVVTDQVGCPTFTGHLAPALLEVAERGLSGLLHAAGGGACSWNELTREAFAQAGLECRVRETTSAEFVRPAPRPAWSVLASERGAPRLPDWREGVRAHLALRVTSK